MANYSGIYSVLMQNVSVSTGPKTIIQIKAGAAANLELLRVWISQENRDTTDQIRVQILRKTAAATVTSYTPILLRTNDGAAKAVGGTAATGTNASAEGTNGDILYEDVFNILNGWLYVPTPEERIQVVNAGIIGITFPATITATNITAGVVFGEQ